MSDKERLIEALRYALRLIERDIDDAMKVRRVNRDVIEELESYEAAIKKALV